MNDVPANAAAQQEPGSLSPWQSRATSYVAGLALSLMAIAVLAEGAGYPRITGLILVGFGSALSLAGIAFFIAFAVDGLIKRNFFMVLGGAFMVCFIVEMDLAIKAVLFSTLS